MGGPFATDQPSPEGPGYFPGAAQFQSMVVNGVLSAMGKVRFLHLMPSRCIQVT